MNCRDGIRGYGRISGTAVWYYICLQEGSIGAVGWSEGGCDVSLALLLEMLSDPILNSEGRRAIRAGRQLVARDFALRSLY